MLAIILASHLTVQFATIPSPPKAGENRFEITLTDDHKQPVADADVTVHLVRHAESVDVKLIPTAPGKYGAARALDKGDWKVTIQVTRHGSPVAQKGLKLTVE